MYAQKWAVPLNAEVPVHSNKHDTMDIILSEDVQK